MKAIYIISLLMCTPVFAGTTLYKFSGNYVHSTVADLPEEMTASEVLDLTDSIICSFPEFYFSDDGIYGSTNWTRFPGTELPTGTEVTLGIEKKADDKLYLDPFGFSYRCLLDWDQVRETPHFAYAKHTLTVGQYVPVGRSFILTGSKQVGSREWIIFRIDQVSEPVKWHDANNEQRTLMRDLLKSLNSNDSKLFLSLWSKLEIDKVNDLNWPPEKLLKLVKGDIQRTLGASALSGEGLTISYSGDEHQGIIRLALSDQIRFYDVIKENGIWKLGD